MTLILLMGAAIAAPFLFHEMGHWAVAKHRGIRLKWFRQGWRLLWEFPEGAFNERERREIGVAGFAASNLGALAFVASAFWFPVPGALACALYSVVNAGYIWHYAVYVDSQHDDFRLIR